MTPEFLDLEDVLELHEASLERWGGSDGIRPFEVDCRWFESDQGRTHIL
ncbi:MAG TPA: hypothetical protein VNO21_14965 [Polyangiaceae bacterium]|nr:hypothetical protein [Polyangiaceae bacterium]